MWSVRDEVRKADAVPPSVPFPLGPCPLLSLSGARVQGVPVLQSHTRSL